MLYISKLEVRFLPSTIMHSPILPTIGHCVVYVLKLTLKNRKYYVDIHISSKASQLEGTRIGTGVLRARAKHAKNRDFWGLHRDFVDPLRIFAILPKTLFFNVTSLTNALLYKSRRKNHLPSFQCCKIKSECVYKFLE